VRDEAGGTRFTAVLPRAKVLPRSIAAGRDVRPSD